MLIDWFTVFAQLVNFLILMALLKRFLYKPIMRALDERENKIAGQLEASRKIKADAERELNEYAYKNQLFEQQREDLLKQAQNDAAHEREKLIEAARVETAALRTGWQQALEIEQCNLHSEIMRKTREEVFAMVRKTLADLASESLEQRIGEVFIRRLHTLNASEKKLLALAIQATSKPIMVYSAFELAPEQKSSIKQVIREVFAVNTGIEFDVDPDRISGIELSTNGHKLSWNIDDYLVSLERSIDQVLAAKTLATVDSGGDSHASG